MGQAFRDGQLVGEAIGDTRREVFEKLDQAHPDADEIRIKSGRGAMDRTIEDAIKLTGEQMLKFFTFEHLPADLQHVSAPFSRLAITIATELPRNAERTVALRKLLEAKDCAVRARLG